MKKLIKICEQNVTYFERKSILNMVNFKNLD